MSPPFGNGSRRHDGPSPRCPGRSGRRPSKPNHVAFGGSRRLSRRGRRRGDATVPGFDRQGARWVLPRSGEPGAADPAGPGARWALPRRGDLRFFLLSFPPRSQERNPPNHLAELPTRKREETAEREARNGRRCTRGRVTDGSTARSTSAPADAMEKTKVSSSRPLRHASVTTSAIPPCRLREGTGSGVFVG